MTNQLNNETKQVAGADNLNADNALNPLEVCADKVLVKQAELTEAKVVGVTACGLRLVEDGPAQERWF